MKLMAKDSIQTYRSGISSLIRQVPKHNVLIIEGDVNVHLGQNDSFKLSNHQNSNSNGEMFKNPLLKNKLLCLNTNFQKRQGQTWTYKAPNSSTSQIDYVIINKK